VALPDLLAQARDLQPRTVALRRAVHRHPELGLHLPRTRDAVLEALADLPLQVHLGVGTTSVVAVLDGARPGPTVLLRGDMDGLPVAEDTGLPFASEVDGRMHACGHDTHVAMLASAARVLAARRDELAGRVLFMFQPGEEGHHGARYMIDEGLLDATGPAGRPERAYALHISATLPAGELHVRPGPLMAAADTLRVVVTGRGGHASAPHDALDPVPAAAAMVGALQTALTREVAATDAAVLTIAHIRAGTTTTSSRRPRPGGDAAHPARRRPRRLRDTVRRVCTHTALAHGCTAGVDLEPGYPIVVNDGAATAHVQDVAAGVLGATSVVGMPAPIMGARTSPTCWSRCRGRSRSSAGARPAPTRRALHPTTPTARSSTSRRWRPASRSTRGWHSTR
jgi:hippurate hydrolase